MASSLATTVAVLPLLFPSTAEAEEKKDWRAFDGCDTTKVCFAKPDDKEDILEKVPGEPDDSCPIGVSMRSYGNGEVELDLWTHSNSASLTNVDSKEELLSCKLKPQPKNGFSVSLAKGIFCRTRVKDSSIGDSLKILQDSSKFFINDAMGKLGKIPGTGCHLSQLTVDPDKQGSFEPSVIVEGDPLTATCLLPKSHALFMVSNGVENHIKELQCSGGSWKVDEKTVTKASITCKDKPTTTATITTTTTTAATTTPDGASNSGLPDIQKLGIIAFVVVICVVIIGATIYFIKKDKKKDKNKGKKGKGKKEKEEETDAEATIASKHSSNYSKDSREPKESKKKRKEKKEKKHKRDKKQKRSKGKSEDTSTKDTVTKTEHTEGDDKSSVKSDNSGPIANTPNNPHQRENAAVNGDTTAERAYDRPECPKPVDSKAPTVEELKRAANGPTGVKAPSVDMQKTAVDQVHHALRIAFPYEDYEVEIPGTVFKCGVGLPLENTP